MTVYLVCRDISPNRATVVAIYSDPRDVERHMAIAGGFTHLVHLARATAGHKVGDRIWRT